MSCSTDNVMSEREFIYRSRDLFEIAVKPHGSHDLLIKMQVTVKDLNEHSYVD